MNGATTRHAASSWTLRRQRTLQLRERSPHADELLTLYGELLQAQESVYEWAAAGQWRVPRSLPLDLGLLPLDSLSEPFGRFVSDLAPRLTEVLRAAGRTLGGAGEGALRELLKTHATGGDLTDLADSLGCEPLQLEFFPRAFLKPIAEALAEQAPGDQEPRSDDGCPRCGQLPQVGVLRDEPDVKNRRLLVCSLCAGWWPFPRLTCPACGERKTGQLLYHESESLEHIRIEECLSCRTYLKTIDLRKDGAAVPEVDDIASVELDLWARERGLRKRQLNLLGF